MQDPITDPPVVIPIASGYTDESHQESIHYSSSQLKMWKTCPKRWYWRYVRGIKKPPKAVMSAGKCVHSTAEAHYNDLMNGLGRWTIQQCSEYARNQWAMSTQSIEWGLEKWKVPQWTDAIASVAMSHCLFIAASEEPPIYVEHRMEVRFPGIERTFVMRIDSIHAHDEAIVVHDIKTQWDKTKPPLPTDHEQVALYVAAVRADMHFARTVGVLDVVSARHAEPVAVDSGSVAVRRILSDLRSMDRGVRARAFVRNTSGWWCSDKWCGWYSDCMKGDNDE